MTKISEKMKFEMRLVAGNGIRPPQIRPESICHTISIPKFFYLVKPKIDDFIQKITPSKKGGGCHSSKVCLELHKSSRLLSILLGAHFLSFPYLSQPA